MRQDYIDTRDLIEKRDELKQQILDSFLETFEHYEDQTECFDDILFEEEEIQDWKEDWLDEITEICEIEKIEDELGSEFEYGVTLVHEDYFEEYTEELLIDCGYISKDFPSWIEIDWEATANNVKQDYTEIEYQGETYYGRI
jgi:hypothetical protein